MKGSKVVLPNISPNSERAQVQPKKKAFKSWIMNDTFSNWKKKPSKSKLQTHSHSPEHNLHESLIQISHLSNIDPKTFNNTGITLGEYFRTRANTQNSIIEETYQAPEDDIQLYLRENFQIHESDEDNYEESENSLHISNKQTSRERQELHSQLSKVKTQEAEPKQSVYVPNISIGASKKKQIHTISQNSKQRIVSMNQLQESLELKNNKNRSLSNKVSKKMKLGENTRRNVLEKVRVDKMRASEMKNPNQDLFSKYAQKFHLRDQSGHD